MRLERKNLHLCFLTFVLTLSVMVFYSSDSHAETKIAVVDVQSLLKDSKAAQSIEEQFVKKKKAFQDELSKQEEALLALEQDILSRKEGMSQADLEKEQKNFQDKFLAAKEKLKEQGLDLEKMVTNATLELRTEIIKVVAEMSEKENYTMVITKQNVILAEKELDITERVMTELNKRVKTIKLDDKKT